MPRINFTDSTDLTISNDCEFRIWSRAELRVDDACVVLEGSHAALMLELLRNRGHRVPIAVLWTAMRGEGVRDTGKSVEDTVTTEIRRIRYLLGTRSIFLSIDDTDPENGFILSAVCRISKERPIPKRQKSRARSSQHQPTTETPRHRTSYTGPMAEFPYSVPERIERRTARGGET